MKKLILILLLAMLANSITASSTPADTTYIHSAKQHKINSNRQMAGEIIFITGGVLLHGIDAAKLVVSSDLSTAKSSAASVTATVFNKKTNSNLTTENGSFTTGIAAIFTGEPLFVLSSKNRRALSVSTTEQVIKKMHRNSISKVSIPSIKLTIHL
jgi:hypothetical protein